MVIDRFISKNFEHMLGSKIKIIFEIEVWAGLKSDWLWLNYQHSF